MTRYNGGSKVRGGYYWNLRKWDITAINGDEGTLNAPAEERFIKLPLPIMVIVAVAVSFSYVIFLPFIGFALALLAAGRKVGVLARSLFRETAATVAPTFRPGEAYFAEKPEGEGKEGAASEKLDKLEKEIAERKGEEKK